MRALDEFKRRRRLTRDVRHHQAGSDPRPEQPRGRAGQGMRRLARREHAQMSIGQRARTRHGALEQTGCADAFYAGDGNRLKVGSKL
jgi:hypothetical protein